MLSFGVRCGGERGASCVYMATVLEHAPEGGYAPPFMNLHRLYSACRTIALRTDKRYLKIRRAHEVIAELPCIAIRGICS